MPGTKPAKPTKPPAPSPARATQSASTNSTTPPPTTTPGTNPPTNTFCPITRENISEHVDSYDRPGSSPLTRGKRRPAPPARRRRGLIPTHAGKTDSTSSCRTYRRAHPRSRGENKQLLVAAASQRGSSPLTRGKRYLTTIKPTLANLIPAHAGKTRCTVSRSRRCRAHPRSRGENFSIDG